MGNLLWDVRIDVRVNCITVVYAVKFVDHLAVCASSKLCALSVAGSFCFLAPG